MAYIEREREKEREQKKKYKEGGWGRERATEKRQEDGERAQKDRENEEKKTRELQRKQQHNGIRETMKILPNQILKRKGNMLEGLWMRDYNIFAFNIYKYFI